MNTRVYNGMECRFMYKSDMSGEMIIIEEITTKYQHEIWREAWMKCPKTTEDKNDSKRKN